jgi:hypothetical protein
MKIKYAIHSSDSNSFYIDFWPLVSKVWKLKFNIEPILIYIDENKNLEIDETYGRVIRIDVVKNIPNYLQNLWVRYWYPMNFPNEVSIISDIDMFPISKKYFIDNLKEIEDHKYLHINPLSNTLPHPPTLPSCYHVAMGYKFKEVLKLDEKWEDSIHKLYELNLGSDHSMYGENLIGKDQWYADERYATHLINDYDKKEDIVLLSRENGVSANRIDRSYWSYDINDFEKYIDSHSIRPYSKYKSNIDFLVEKILNGQNMNKIEFIIITCEKYHNDRLQAVKQTWGRGQNCKFLSDVSIGEDIIGYPNLTKGYEFIYLKYIEYIKQMTNFESDWYMFTDDDTFVNISNIDELLSKNDHNNPICIGRLGRINPGELSFPLYTISGNNTSLPINYCSGGAGFILSKKSMMLISDYIKNENDIPRCYYSDVTFGFWMRNAGVEIVAIDRFEATNPDALGHSDGEIKKSYTYHYVNPIDMYKINNILSKN